MPTPDDFLKNWFDLLATMQSVMKTLNLDTSDDLGTFATQKVKVLLSGGVQRQTFEQKMSSRLLIADSDLDGASTFSDLLNAVYNPLNVYVQGVFQRVAGSAYEKTSPSDFAKLLTTQVYPTANARQSLINALQADMRDPWFPNQKEKKSDKLRSQLANVNNKVADSVTFVATV